MDFSLTLASISVAFLAFLGTLLLTPIIRRMAISLGYVDRPGERKIHEKVTPYGGGIAIYLVFMGVLSGAYLLAISPLKIPGMEALEAALTEHLAGLTASQTHLRMLAILGGGTVMFLLGLFDDRYLLSPWLKLALQTAGAVGLYLSGIRITLFLESELLSLLVTILWVVGITNAMNLLDNMDGLSAGMGAIASFLFFLLAVESGQLFVGAMLAVLFGTLLGFLVYNFNPASLFMGDAGALFLGFLLAAAAMNTTYYHGQGRPLSVIAPVVVLAIPLFDTLSVMVIRYRSGKPLMNGDKNHFSHRLVRLGMTVREAVLTIYILSLTIGITAVLLPQLKTFGHILILLHTFGMITVIILLESAAARRKQNE